jgi:hypothetical protein
MTLTRGELVVTTRGGYGTGLLSSAPALPVHEASGCDPPVPAEAVGNRGRCLAASTAMTVMLLARGCRDESRTKIVPSGSAEASHLERHPAGDPARMLLEHWFRVGPVVSP